MHQDAQFDSPRPCCGFHWLAVALWTLIVAGACCRVLVIPHGSPGTYPIYASAGECWLAGVNPYPARDGMNVYRYSPAFTGLFAPFTLCPDPIGNALWRLLNAAVYLAGLICWTRVALPRPLCPNLRYVFFLLVIPLSVSSLVNAQSNALLIGLILLATSAAVMDRWNLAAVCLTGAALLKVYPLVVALLLVLLFPRRFAFRFAVAFLLGLALPFLLQRHDYVWDQYVTWLRLLSEDSDRSSWAVIDWYRDVRLLAKVWLTPMSAAVYHSLQLIVAAAIAGVCWLAQRRERRLSTHCSTPLRRRDRLLMTVFGLTCCWMTVFGPATEANTYILLAPTLAWSMLEAWTEERSWTYRTAVSGSFVMFTVAQAAIWFPRVREFHSMGPHPLAGLLLFGALMGAAVRELKAPAREMPSHEVQSVAA